MINNPAQGRRTRAPIQWTGAGVQNAWYSMDIADIIKSLDMKLVDLIVYQESTEAAAKDIEIELILDGQTLAITTAHALDSGVTYKFAAVPFWDGANFVTQLFEYMDTIGEDTFQLLHLDRAFKTLTCRIRSTSVPGTAQALRGTIIYES